MTCRIQALRPTTYDQHRAVRAYTRAQAAAAHDAGQPIPEPPPAPPVVATGQGPTERHTDGAGLIDLALYVATALGGAVMLALLGGLLFLAFWAFAR